MTDNLDLALSAQGSAEDLKRGVEMIHRQMVELLRRFGVIEVSAVGQPFDPTLHEAVSREESRGGQVADRGRPSCGAATSCTTGCCGRRW